MERWKSYVPSMEEGVRRAQEGNYAFIGEAVSLDLAVGRYCKLTRAQDVIGMRGYSIAAPIGEQLSNVCSKMYQLTPTHYAISDRILHVLFKQCGIISLSLSP